MSSFYTKLDGLTPPPMAINNSHKDYSIAIAVIVLGIVASLAVFARLIQRTSSKTLGLDDYMMIPTEIVFIAWTAMAAWFILNSGIGKPLGEVTYGEFINFYKGIFVATWMYPIMSAMIRIAVLLFYRRVFARNNKWTGRVIWILLGLQLVYVVIFEIIPGFACTPIYDGWEPIKRLTSCTDLYIDGTIALYSTSLAFDILILAFPLRLIWKLQLSLKKKMGISAILVIGSGACIAAAYKLAIFVDKSHDWSPSDPMWFTYQASAYIPPQFNSYGSIFWIPTQVEPTAALIGTSVPALLQIFSAASLQFSKIRSRVSAGSRKSSLQRNQDKEDSSLRVSASIGGGSDRNIQKHVDEYELHPISSPANKSGQQVV